MSNDTLDLYAKITLLKNFGRDVLSLRGEARKEDLKEILVLGNEIHELLSEGGGLYPLYLSALDAIRENIGTLLYLSYEEVEEILPPYGKKFAIPWGIHYSELYLQGLIPWANTLGVTPAEVWYMFEEPGNPPESFACDDGSWNSDLSREEILWMLR